MDELIKLDQVDELDFNATQEDEQPISIGEGVAIFGGGVGGITEEELEEALATKVDKIVTDSGFEFAYTHQNGTELKKVVSSSSGSAYIPIRRGDSKNFDVGTPIRDEECSNKKYVDDKFNGANKAVSFINYSSMITSLNALGNTSYNVGQNIMIVTLQVPDLWVSEIAETSVAYTYVSDDDFVNELTTNGSVQVGYYKLSALETQKVDLTEYAKLVDLDTKVSQIEYSTEQTFADGSDGGVVGRAYMRFRDNTENSIVLNCQNTKYSVPVRDASGNFYVGNPIQLYHTVNRKFLEDNYTNEVASTTYNNSTGKYEGEAGLFMYDGGGRGGFFKSTTGADGANRFRIKKASFAEITNRSVSDYHDAGVGSPNQCCPITPANLDYAVIEVLTNSKIDLTEEQVSAIQNWLGLGDINTALEGILGV